MGVPTSFSGVSAALTPGLLRRRPFPRKRSRARRAGMEALERRHLRRCRDVQLLLIALVPKWAFLGRVSSGAARGEIRTACEQEAWGQIAMPVTPGLVPGGIRVASLRSDHRLPGPIGAPGSRARVDDLPQRGGEAEALSTAATPGDPLNLARQERHRDAHHHRSRHQPGPAGRSLTWDATYSATHTDHFGNALGGRGVRRSNGAAAG